MDKNTLKDERERQDKLESDQHIGCNQNHSSTGMCPCCGVELDIETEEKWTGTFENVLCIEEQQICPSCGWTSDYLYDT